VFAQGAPVFLPAFIPLSACLFVSWCILAAITRAPASHKPGSKQDAATTEATWLTPVSEVTNWYPLHFLPSSVFFPPPLLHVRAGCRSHRRNSNPSLRPWLRPGTADGAHPPAAGVGLLRRLSAGCP